MTIASGTKGKTRLQITEYRVQSTEYRANLHAVVLSTPSEKAFAFSRPSSKRDNYIVLRFPLFTLRFQFSVFRFPFSPFPFPLSRFPFSVFHFPLINKATMLLHRGFIY